MSVESSIPDRSIGSTEARNGVYTYIVNANKVIDVYASPQFLLDIQAGMAHDDCEVMIIDVSKSGHVDSTGLGALISAHSLAQESSIRLLVDTGPAGKQDNLMRLLRITGLNEVFCIIESRDTAD